MSNAKIRARRRGRARRAWEKTTRFVHYYDCSPEGFIACDYRALETRELSNAERRAEGSDHYQRALSKLIAERYPGVMQIHDCFTFEGPVAEAAAVKERMSEVLRHWHKTAGFGASFSVDRPDSLKNFGLVHGDPFNPDDTSEHPAP